MPLRLVILAVLALIAFPAAAAVAPAAAQRLAGEDADEKIAAVPAIPGPPRRASKRPSARAEDIMVNQVLNGRAQVFEDGWAKRLGITRRDFGIGMSSPEVTELTRLIDLNALREYRDAVGRRTRDIVSGFKAQDWDGQVSAEGMQAAADAGGFGVRTEALLKTFTGRPRTAVLSGLAIFHPAAHMGEAATVRTAGGFGTGV